MSIGTFPSIPEQHLPLEYRAALRSLLSELVVSGERVAKRPTRRYFVTSVAALTAIGTGGAFAYSQLSPSRPVTDKQSARCYSQASYAPGDDFPGTTIGQPDSAAGPGQVSAALDACAAMWRAGIVQPGAPTAIHNPDRVEYPVPHLAACVLPDGRAAIFPGTTGVCEQLGLQAAAAAPPS